MGLIAKWILKGLLMSLVMSALMSYVFFLQTGRTPWSLLGIHSVQDLKPDLPGTADLSRLAESLADKAGSAASRAGDLLPGAPAEPVQVYRWVDAQGVTHFSESPPEGEDAQVITVDPNQNVIQGMPAKPSEQEANALENLQQQLRARAEATQQAQQALGQSD